MKNLKLYVPGMFSLLSLFPLLMYQLCKNGVLKKEYVLEVNWFSPTEMIPLAYNFPPPRDYTEITLTGGTSNDNIKIEYAKVLLNEMVAGFDTARGVRIHFTDTAKYESFIEVLDFYDKQFALVSVLYKSDFWLYNRFGSEEHKTRSLSGICDIIMPVNSSYDESIQWPFAYTFDRGIWPVAVLFIVLCGLGFIANFRAVTKE